MIATTIADRAPWLGQPDLQRLMAALGADGDEAQVVGGAVRNTLLGEPVSDIDLATTTLPAETEARAGRAGFRTVPTGMAHGTVTVIVAGKPVEVTTLRADVATDGRHATVVFGRDWSADAQRRDFTINAIYARADGSLLDPVGGLADLETRTVRFIGDADERIREDYLRILRFFRFFAHYGSGRPDGDGLRAAARLKAGLERLSAERVWTELRKLLSAPDPSRSLLWMRQAGVLTTVLPESEKWGIDAIHGVVSAGQDLGWTPDPLLRLQAMLPPDPARMVTLAARLKLSNDETARLVDWAMAPRTPHEASEGALARLLYGAPGHGVRDQLALALAGARVKAADDSEQMLAAAGYARQLAFARNWVRPVMPLGGDDLKTLGMAAGPALGAALAKLEAEWVASGFAMDRAALLDRAASIVGA